MICKYNCTGNEISTNFEQLIAAIKHHAIKGKLHYFVFDNVNRLFGRKLFRRILVMKRILKDYIRVIMICNGFILELKFFDEFLLSEESFVPLYMPNPTKDCLKLVLKDNLNECNNPSF